MTGRPRKQKQEGDSGTPAKRGRPRKKKESSEDSATEVGYYSTGYSNLFLVTIKLIIRKMSELFAQ